MRLALGPLAAPSQLMITLRDVVREGIAGDMGQRVVLIDIAGILADDDRKLDLPVGSLRTARNGDRVVRAGDRGGRLQEQQRLLRYVAAAFAGVIDIVEADADDFRRRRYAGTKRRIVVDARQDLRVD